MMIQEVIESQYYAALEMLKRAIEGCPPSLWDDPAYKNRYWHVAYHALFYTHLYLQPSEEDFSPWEKHREEASSLSEEPDAAPVEPYSKAEVLEYLAFCQAEVSRQTAGVDLHAASGFYWLPFTKLELQFYNIRHIQQHAGELCERLGKMAGVDVDWVGMKAK